MSRALVIFSSILLSLLCYSFCCFFLFLTLHLLFVCPLRRSLFLCAVLIILSCFCDNVYVPLAYVDVGVITMLNKRSLWHRRYALEVSSCLYLWNAAHAAFSLFLISSVSCSSNVIFCPRYRALSLFGKTSILMLSTVISFFFSFSWVLSIFVLSG